MSFILVHEVESLSKEVGRLANQPATIPVAAVIAGTIYSLITLLLLAFNHPKDYGFTTWNIVPSELCTVIVEKMLATLNLAGVKSVTGEVDSKRIIPPFVPLS